MAECTRGKWLVYGSGAHGTRSRSFRPKTYSEKSKQKNNGNYDSVLESDRSTLFVWRELFNREKVGCKSIETRSTDARLDACKLAKKEEHKIQQETIREGPKE